ncbi:MAG: PilZ domain-containing protein [Deltaproteobacteria bacterium]|nr:PilZ domain-containing protein [Deltaproteobacteria bacterium]
MLNHDTTSRPMERRASDRRPCRMPVRVFAEPGPMAESFHLDSCDVSEEGVFLATELLFPVGEWLEVELTVPGRARPIRRRGRVTRVLVDDALPGPGVAVRFHGLTEEERTALGRLSADALR